MLKYFNDSYHKNSLEQVMVHTNVSQYLNKDRLTNIAYLAVFYVMKEGRKHYYCYAANDNNNAKLKQFINYGIQRKTLKVLKIEFLKVNAIKDSFVPSALPREILKQVMPHELKLGTQVINAIKGINYMGVLSDVTQHYDESIITKVKLSKESVQFLTKCQIKEYSEPLMNYIEAESNDFRAEDRFQVNTKIIFSLNGKDYVGYTSDLSTKGFRARLEDATHLYKNDKIKITFEDYQYKQNTYNLTNLSYRIVHIHNNIIACKLSGDIKTHDGAIFWRKYIYSNYHKLRATGNNNEILGLSRALRNIFSKNHNNLPCFFEIKNKQAVPFMLSYSQNLNERNDFLKKLNINENNMNEELRSLFFNYNFLDRLDRANKEVTKDNPFISLRYYINAKSMASGKKLFKVFFEDQIGCDKERQDFLFPKDNSETFVFELQITKKTRVFNKYFKNEIIYIESYAAYKAEELLEQLNKISGIVELKDISNIIKSQYKLLT